MTTLRKRQPLSISICLSDNTPCDRMGSTRGARLLHAEVWCSFEGKKPFCTSVVKWPSYFHGTSLLSERMTGLNGFFPDCGTWQLLSWIVQREPTTFRKIADSMLPVTKFEFLSRNGNFANLASETMSLKVSHKDFSFGSMGMTSVPTF